MSRADRLEAVLYERELGALIVTNLVNVRYLTGYTGSNGLALIGPELRVFATDFRYREQVAEEVDPSFERREVPRDLVTALTDVLPDGALRVGFEADPPPFGATAIPFAPLNCPLPVPGLPNVPASL